MYPKRLFLCFYKRRACPAEQITDGVDGFLCEPENLDILAEKLKIVMENESLREEFGKKAYENNKRFSTESITEKWKNLLERL